MPETKLKELKIKVMPSEIQVADKRLKKIKYDLPKIPSNMLFCARAGGGKTSLLYTMLNEGYVVNGKSIFSEAIFFIGTLDGVEAFKNLPIKNIVVLHEFNAEDFHTYLQDLKEHQMERISKGKHKHHTLLVFDDFIGNDVMKSTPGKGSILEKVMLQSRHELNMTVMVCSQTYKHKSFTTPTIRNNINYYFLGSLAKNDVLKIAEEHSGDLSKDEFVELYHDIHSEPYKFMLIDYKKMCFKNGFTDVVHSFHEKEKLKHKVEDSDGSTEEEN